MPGHTEPEPELPQIDNGECGAALLGPRPGVGHQHTMVTQWLQPRPHSGTSQARVTALDCQPQPGSHIVTSIMSVMTPCHNMSCIVSAMTPI